jgi:hypothetical protein
MKLIILNNKLSPSIAKIPLVKLHAVSIVEQTCWLAYHYDCFTRLLRAV